MMVATFRISLLRPDLIIRGFRMSILIFRVQSARGGLVRCIRFESSNCLTPATEHVHPRHSIDCPGILRNHSNTTATQPVHPWAACFALPAAASASSPCSLACPHNIAGFVHPFDMVISGAASCVTGFLVTLTKRNLYSKGI